MNWIRYPIKLHSTKAIWYPYRGLIADQLSWPGTIWLNLKWWEAHEDYTLPICNLSHMISEDALNDININHHICINNENVDSQRCGIKRGHIAITRTSKSRSIKFYSQLSLSLRCCPLSFIEYVENDFTLAEATYASLNRKNIWWVWHDLVYAWYVFWIPVRHQDDVFTPEITKTSPTTEKISFAPMVRKLKKPE